MQFQKPLHTGSCVNYKESYGMYVCCGILFNHESYLRNKNFFVKKVLQEAIEIKYGKRDILEVGNLDIKRDFGYAPKFVEAMYLMMQKEKPDKLSYMFGQISFIKSIS